MIRALLASLSFEFKRAVFSPAGLQPEDYDANLRALERQLRQVNKAIHALNRAQADDPRRWREPKLRRLHARRDHLQAEYAVLTVERAVCAAELRGTP